LPRRYGTYGWRYIHAGRDRTCWLLPTTTRSEAEGRQPWGFGGRPPEVLLVAGAQAAARPGRSGQQPPRSSMAMAMSASGSR
jgi:hypothetical protein